MTNAKSCEECGSGISLSDWDSDELRQEIARRQVDEGPEYAKATEFRECFAAGDKAHFEILLQRTFG